MKNFLIGTAAVVCALSFASCNEKARLASEVEGTWSAAPSSLANNASGDYTVIDTYTFTRDASGGEGGSVMITGMLNGVMASTHPVLSLDQPISTSVSGTATITGTWKAVDDDEIAVMLDPTSLKVTVNPVEMVLTSNILTDATANKPEEMSASVADKAKMEFERVLRPYYTRINHLDDVKVKDGTILKYEIGDRDYSMMRQGQAGK